MFKIIAKQIVAIIFLTILSGCAARGPNYVDAISKATPIQDNMARIVFFRTRESALYIARKATISIDDEKVGATAYGGFHYHDVQTGIYRLRADMWDAPGRCELILDASVGQTYYFQVDPRDESFGAFAVSGFAAEMVSSGVLIGLAGGLAGSTAESLGKECSGAFRLYPVDQETANSKLLDLKLSQ